MNHTHSNTKRVQDAFRRRENERNIARNEAMFEWHFTLGLGEKGKLKDALIRYRITMLVLFIYSFCISLTVVLFVLFCFFWIWQIKRVKRFFRSCNSFALFFVFAWLKSWTWPSSRLYLGSRNKIYRFYWLKYI